MYDWYSLHMMMETIFAQIYIYDVRFLGMLNESSRNGRETGRNCLWFKDGDIPMKRVKLWHHVVKVA